MRRRIFILHNPVGPEDDPSTADVLDEAAWVERGLAELGLPAERRAVAGLEGLAALAPAAREPGAVVFNLIESPPGDWRLQCAAAGALELLGLPFTGSPAAALWLTTDKLLTRAALAAEGLPVAPGGRLDPERPAVLDRVPPPWILKPACEDASVGLEGSPVCATREQALARAAELARRFPGQGVLAEAFLPGRELNVSLLEGPDGPEVLPIPEIVFVDWPAGVPQIVGWEAKWDESSPECRRTVRRFLAHPADAPLAARAGELAREAWRACGLSGYARVDLRLDAAGEPFLLEVNANPCISAGAGFTAAAGEAGLGAAEVVRRILEAAARRSGKGSAVAVPAPQRATGERPAVALRRGLAPADRQPLEELLRATGFFNPEEVEVALELADDVLASGEASHYRFLVGEVDGRLAGYACWGPIPGTRESADLYWIATHPDFQNRKVGTALLEAAESWIAESGRRRVYVETSTRARYDATRAFYRARGYHLAAELPDFYAPGDGKAVFVRGVGGRSRPGPAEP
jgi:D-alanine-D-alanine ligase